MMVRCATTTTTTCDKAIVLLLLSHCAIARRTREDLIYVAEEKKAISHLKPLVLIIIRARGDEILPDLASGCKLLALVAAPISIDFGSISHLDCPPEDFSAELDVEGGQT